MRITNSHRGQTTNLAKCTKMTEGEHRIHGMNGVTDSGSAATKEDSPQPSDAYSLGGRLKFFKNGRFILELARAREGEKVAWVPVPKKTFWPPQGSASSVSTYRQESSTSLSVSDDNSSVQSSPWQRDHTWKQTSPQRNAASHLSFYFCCPRGVRRPSRCVHRLQRAPYTSASDSLPQCNKCNTSCVSKSAMKPSLVHIVQLLWNKSVQALNITSPRKRILRELERVTIDDLSLKRCRGKLPAVNGAGVDEHSSTNANTNAKNCSYSITSLLGKQESRDREKEKERNHRDEKLSSQNLIASKINTHHRTATATTATPAINDDVVVVSAPSVNYGQDVVDGPRPATVDIMSTRRSPVSTSTGRSSSLSASPTAPAPGAEHYAGHGHAYPATAYMSPYHMYGVLGPPPPGLYYSAFSRNYYPSPAPGYLPHTPPQPYSWPMPPNTYQHALHADDSVSVSDVPLNLSKHAD